MEHHLFNGHLGGHQLKIRGNSPTMGAVFLTLPVLKISERMWNMGKRGPKRKQKPEEVKPAADGAGIEEASTTQDEPGTVNPGSEVPAQEQAAITLPPVSEGQPIQLAPKEEETPPPPTVDPVNPPEVAQETLVSDTCLYHATNEPRVFRAGSQIPSGWQRKRDFKGFVWSVDDYGKWIKEEK